MNKEIEVKIKPALDAAMSMLDPVGARKIYEEYDGYAASLGAAIVTSGLLPALSFYTDVAKPDVNKNNQPLPRRYKILQAISAVLGLGNGKTALLDHVLSLDQAEENAIKKEILSASIALKLALRSFEHIKSPQA
ncbi:MAG: hypothetical protein KBG02_07590 [Haliscomenobacter sp.]|nr:hypothetical protein [Haliscomenobacter sp.]